MTKTTAVGVLGRPCSRPIFKPGHFVSRQGGLLFLALLLAGCQPESTENPQPPVDQSWHPKNPFPVSRFIEPPKPVQVMKIEQPEIPVPAVAPKKKDLCGKHGKRKVFVSKYKWRCL